MKVNFHNKNGEQFDMNILQTAFLSDRMTIGDTVAKMVVTDQGEYRPYLYDAMLAECLLKVYTDGIKHFEDEKGHPNLELIDPIAVDAIKLIQTQVGSEVSELIVQIHQKIEYRKSCGPTYITFAKIDSGLLTIADKINEYINNNDQSTNEVTETEA